MKGLVLPWVIAECPVAFHICGELDLSQVVNAGLIDGRNS